MTKRYLRVDVTKELYSEIYLEVDKSDPHFTELLKETKREKALDKYTSMLKSKRLPEEIHKLVLQEASELDDLDWGPADFSASWFPAEVTKDEAEKYGITQIPPQEEKKDADVPPLS